ncbi:glycosyltransferase [Pyrococcus yayanosii]|uniref:Glycosyl transferase, group 1 family protein n=1 Tax=Pyrococcus yayanosii (strain CH1 / JCM 16557) TaxID=529709 RepID=F8AEF5_PYRYC|nr:glycosyltransferase [Pyrococcus yayanosii]AEH25422.1 glycosyl transferase, group 1 family protein [Pyrococcus yayanosii CH1]
MRILQVVHGLYPMRKAGTEIYTYYLSRELAKEHEVHVFYPVFEKTAKRELRIREIKREGMHLHELVIPNGILDKIKRLWSSMFFENTYRNLEIEEIFEKLLKEVNPDIIHFQHLIGLSAGLIEIAKRHGFPTVLTLHDYWFMCPTINLLRWDYSLCEGLHPEMCWSEKQLYNLGEI